MIYRTKFNFNNHVLLKLVPYLTCKCVFFVILRFLPAYCLLVLRTADWYLLLPLSYCFEHKDGCRNRYI